MEYGIKRKSSLLKTVLLIIALIGFAIFSVTQGSVRIPVSNVISIIFSNDAADAIKPAHVFIVEQVRLPRILLSASVGGILAVIGAVFQALFKNPMADPYVMGVSSGAAFGATLGIVFGVGVSLAGMSLVSKISTTGILLAGIVVNALLSSLISFIMIVYHNEIDRIVTWTMGSFNAASWDHVKLIILPMFFGVAYMISLSRELNTLNLSEEDAKNMGVDVERIKKTALVVASLLAAFSVSVSGIIGFVGLIVPHFFRMIFGSDHRILLPVSFIGGALFMLICDTLARSVLPNMEIPVGIITSIIGGPFFLMLLHKHKKKMEN